ncbi:tRNA lysidine(34) synthetase TilS [Clostridium tyrobutyricum]|uniref:tRNA(Ile)-lysidine synthase n=1 Tax=Clostridium tyrobutyricum DIVETGP TaxID=1408889 RepID=W6N6Q3_CLOTY|nr:tRNA lysidine(34) synthetase TilS [Clostridium tyrobutyricum]AND86172.1 tRNA(Ile)-lysidine synthase [Clostridium tyrobutyricum]MBR9648262.1 tRNA lysidine(34) synthetase TilS [Clostridium tyrobutyricum]MBV4416680.1 tRNA lysidine(34) synthetase TilS [Clostridium tyrobutyricum]MBV4422553.1 tRNA lysidine(34) synthetase TilS [Clostridium tyrobutyricum]MBV4426239.1 tRNA lysidine(34) synthetase TilS [Clostridium tyrobutyricum]
MIKTVLNTIKENNMLCKKDKVVVAVSGGPDSLCLLHILYKLKEELDINLYVAHLNHCLRGKESDEDEKFVKNFCQSLDIEFRSKRVDINKISQQRNMSCETAGRKVRYEFFNEVKKEVGAQKVAIAHNANDQAETVLMRIMRGTGLEGLTGIKAVRDHEFIRPLINTTRCEIENYCKEENLNPQIDKTNLETIYSRNKIRLELIPYIEKNFNKDIINTINRLSDTIKVDNNYLDSIAKEKFKKYCDTCPEKVIISKEAFLEDEAIVSRILRLSLRDVCGNLYDFEKIHIYDIMRIQKHSTGKQIMLPNRIIVSNDYGDMIISKNIKKAKMSNDIYVLHEGINNISNNCAVYIESYCNEGIKNISKNKFIQYFDYDKIKGNIILRNRKEGDKFIPIGMKGSKKLKNMFIDLKISKERRNDIPLICFGKSIAWVVGYRMGELFKIDKHTKKILAIEFEGEEI